MPMEQIYFIYGDLSLFACVGCWHFIDSNEVLPGDSLSIYREGHEMFYKEKR